LNEYQKGKEKSEQAEDYEVYKWELDSRWDIVRYDTDDPREWYNLYSDVTPSYLTSKSFWFIKWLVENDKIDFEWKLNTLRFESLVDQTLDSYLALLMLLAIQDEPIRFICEILK
jgi:hypothetical protein